MSGMIRFKCALMLGGALLVPAAAAAQSAPATGQPQVAVTTPEEQSESSEIVVSGFRSSLNAALGEKRAAVNAVDVILAEDIADFPDLNLAESIQRIPGVSIDRDNGEGRTITVRGLNPDFTRVRINGMETLSTTGSTDSSGGTNRGRGFDFNTFASELFRSIKVSKSPNPSTEEGSLGAVVDLATARPLDYGAGLTLAGSGQALYNDASQKVNPRIAALASYANEAETFGALVSVAWTPRDIVEEGFSTVRFVGNPVPAAGAAQSFTQRNAFQNEAAFPTAATAFFPRIPRYGVLTSDQDRLGITGAVQFRPSERTLVSLDLLYSKFAGTRREEFLEAISFSRNTADGIRQTDIVALEVDPATRNIISGTFDDVDVRIENRLDDLKTEFKQATLDIEHEFSDTFKVRLNGGLSESDFRISRQTTIIADALNVDGYRIDFSGNPNAPLIDYNIDVTNPANFLVNEVRDRPQSTLNEFKTVALAGDWAASDTLTVQAGASYKQFGFSSTESRRDRVLTSTTVVQPFALTAAESNLARLGKGAPGPDGIDRTWVVPDIDAIATRVGLYSGNFPLTVQAGAVNDVVENDYAGFLQGSLDTELGDWGLRAVAGVRYVRTEVSATGILSGTTVTVDNAYNDWLPSLSVVLEPTAELLIRGNIARQMARPTLASLTPGGTFNPFSTTLSFGNPQLDPFRANSFDLGIEWYFAPEALLSVAVFYKDIETFVTRETTTIPFRDLGLPDSLLEGSPSSPDDIFTVTRNINGEGGDLKGIEIQYQQPFTFLPGVLKNFGFLGNLTLLDSDVNYGTTAAPLRDQLTGLSKTGFNTTLYYEDSKFSARISGAYRSSFLTRVPGQNGNDIEGTRATFNVDAAMSYALTDNIRITLEGINLTDEVRPQFVDSVGDRPVTFNRTGRTVLIGARFTL
ncbi:TonB-dependent receptor [Erythrobacter sp. BLCC-B19]|uniref:TonB-dependent receptor n=1 Tax=Erythrobacter sp. BLCC-B19 TaxID=3025315 RepID=UPI00235F9CB0|nr:TonB-dependent receptor [Erythrobacter sp. BLCC-B19]WDA42908.1 TonB-dependent receptor [Erythrobacter sp. BLCC-B19]